MFKSIRYCLIFTFLFSSLFSQPLIEPISFETANPLWARVPITREMGNLVGCTLELGARSEKLNIRKGILYNVYIVFFSYIDGYYIEAIDINTGKVIWDHTFIGDTIGNRYYGQNLNFRDDSIDLTFYKEDNPTKSKFWVAGSAHKITYNSQTGKALPVKIDLSPDSRYFPIPLSLFANTFRTHIYYNSVSKNLNLISNGYYQDTSRASSTLELRKYNIGEQSEVIDSFIKFYKFDNLPSSCNLFDLNSELLGVSLVNSFKKAGLEYLESNFITLDHDLNLLTRCKLTVDDNDIQSNYVYSVSDSRIITMANYNYLDNYKVFKSIYVYNYQGQVLEKIDLSSLKLEDSYKDQTDISPVSLTIDGKDRVLLSILSRRQGRYSLSLYLSNGMGKLTRMFSDNVIAKNKSSMGLFKTAIHDNKLLLYFQAIETGTGLLSDPNCCHWVVFSLQDVLSKVEDNIAYNSQVHITPNPHSEYFEIDIDPSESGKIEIIDMNGIIVKSLNRLPDNKLISTSELLDGVYWLKYISSNSIKTTKIVKTTMK